jgi:chaperonin GroES
MELQPTAGRVLVKSLEAKAKSGCIIIPEAAKERPQEVEVVKVNGKTDDFRPGDKVIAQKFTGTEITINGEHFRIVEIKDIIAVVV